MRINRGEIAVLKSIFPAIDLHGFGLIIDLVQQQSVRHAEFRAAQQLLPFQLEEDHGDGLVHSGGKQLVLFRVLVRVRVHEFYFEAMGVAVPVYLIGKNRQRAQRDAVTGLDHVQIVVVDGVCQHCGYQGPGAGGGAHPQNIVVAPLNIHAMVVQNAVHNNICPGATVKNIAHDVQMVNSEPLNDLADSPDQICRLTDIDSGLDNVIIIILAHGGLAADIHQLIDNIGIALRDSQPHLVAGILHGNPAAQGNQPVQRDAVPLVQILFLVCHHGKLLLRVIDQRGQFIAVTLGQAVPEQLIQFLLDFTGAGVQQMQKGLILTMDIGDKMLRTLRQVQNCLQIDDLGAGGLYGGVLFCQHTQIMDFVLRKDCLHSCVPPYDQIFFIVYLFFLSAARQYMVLTGEFFPARI